MCKTLKLCVLTATLAAVLAGLAAAADVTAVNELVDHSLQWNGKTVAIEGEAIGEMLPRGNYAWVNVNDGTNAIGVWMPLADAKKIGVYGDYHHTGDTLRDHFMSNARCEAVDNDDGEAFDFNDIGRMSLERLEEMGVLDD